MILNKILAFLFDIFGWKLVGVIPPELKKATFAVAPHNTWTDFPLGLATRAKAKVNISYLGKAELFKPPFGFIFRWLGGTPVERFQNLNMVDSYSKVIIESDDKLFAVAPEGTRKNVKKLRTGFYYMSLNTKIPIIRVGFDFVKKEVIFGEPFHPTGNFEEDMKTYFVPFFKKINGFQKDWVKLYENGIFDEK